jgi:hypothetical protein
LALTQRNLVMMCSLGIPSNTQRVVIPPDLEAPTPEAFETSRAAIRKLFVVHADLAQEFGFQTWLPA